MDKHPVFLGSRGGFPRVEGELLERGTAWMLDSKDVARGQHRNYDIERSWNTLDNIMQNIQQRKNCLAIPYRE